jgi:hypothetical protein
MGGGGGGTVPCQLTSGYEVVGNHRLLPRLQVGFFRQLSRLPSPTRVEKETPLIFVKDAENLVS